MDKDRPKPPLASPPGAPRPDSGSSAYRNMILASLSDEVAREVRKHLTRVHLVKGQILVEQDERIEQVWFVERGFVSMVARLDKGAAGVEVALSGCESMVGLLAIIGRHPLSLNCAMVQLGGEAYRMPVAALTSCLEQMPRLRHRLLRAFHVEMAQISQSAACNGRHTVPQRCARWLLMAGERAGSDHLSLTQEFLSVMLSVRRPGVTLALGSLQKSGLIRTHRGNITIVDRQGLTRAACECYTRIGILEAKLAALDDER